MEHESWKAIIGGEYEVSSAGVVRRARDSPARKAGYVLKTHLDRRGRARVELTTPGAVGRRARYYNLPRIVCTAFHGEPITARMTVNHIDGNPLNNRADNLEWMTLSENIRHAYRTGLKSSKGSSHPQAKLTDADVARIVERIRAGELYAQIAVDYGVSKVLISLIGKGRAWTHLGHGVVRPPGGSGQYDRSRSRHSRARLFADDVRTIRALGRAGARPKDVAARFHITEQHAGRLLRGRGWQYAERPVHLPTPSKTDRP